MQTRALKIAVVVWGIAGCGSHTDSICENVSACSQGGDATWISRCKTEAFQLDQQAIASACTGPYTAYFQCADSHYVCDGVTASFPGCDSQQSDLESCLDAAPAHSACTAYSSRLAGCPGDAGTSPPGSPIPTACNLHQQCVAQCFLTNVASACVPGLSELDAFNQCAASCPP